MMTSPRSALITAALCTALIACDSPSSSLALDELVSSDKDNTYTVGELIQLDAAVKNDGDDPSAFGAVHAYRSVDSAFTEADTHLGLFSVVNVGAGATEQRAVPIATGGWSPGRYFVGVCANRVGSSPSTDCKSVEVDVLASQTLTGIVPGALLVNATTVTADANGDETVAIGQALTFNSAATDSYSIAVYRSESLNLDSTAAQVGFFIIANGDKVWRADLDTATWKANTDLYLSACWANGGLANNLTDCYQMAAPIRILRSTNL